jgi:hypothetical protein
MYISLKKDVVIATEEGGVCLDKTIPDPKESMKG